jgi:hypothetical protein
MNQASMGAISGENLKEALDIFEAKFAWMVYIMAVFVGNRPVSSCSGIERMGILIYEIRPI